MSIPVVTISLALSIGQPAATATTESADCFVDVGFGRSPQNAPLLLELPPSVNTPGGVLVAPERAADVAWRMGCYQRWPRACQVALDAQAAAHAVELAEQRRVTDVVARLRLEEQTASRWPTWAIVGLSAAAAASVAFAAGLIVGFSASR